jgi:hypothetical protein
VFRAQFAAMRRRDVFRQVRLLSADDEAALDRIRGKRPSPTGAG